MSLLRYPFSFIYIAFKQSQNKNFSKDRIRTLIVRAEDKHVDHYTTTTSIRPNVKFKLYNLSILEINIVNNVNLCSKEPL